LGSCFLCRFLGRRPGGGQQRGEVVLVGHAGEALEHPFEVGEGVEPMPPHLLDEGIDHGAAPAGIGPTDEHPVLHPKLGGTDGVFGEVVVELDLTVLEAGQEVGPLATGVAQRFAQLAGGGDASSFLKVGNEFCEMLVVPTGYPLADPSAQFCGDGFAARAQLALDLVYLFDLVEYPGAYPGMIARASWNLRRMWARQETGMTVFSGCRAMKVA
jgi:hypothetical protein